MKAWSIAWPPGTDDIKHVVYRIYTYPHSICDLRMNLDLIHEVISLR